MKDKKLCNISDIDDGDSAAFTIDVGGKPKMVLAVRKDDNVFVYLNSCPHTGGPLDIRAGKFLTKEKKHILCSTHGALFNIENGFCVFGPCKSSFLEAMPVTVQDGKVLIL